MLGLGITAAVGIGEAQSEGFLAAYTEQAQPEPQQTLETPGTCSGLARSRLRFRLRV